MFLMMKMLRYKIIPVTLLQQNSTLIWCEKTQLGAVIDPGGDIDKINTIIKQHHIHVEKILLTHGHLDHVGGAKTLAEEYNIPILGPHENDKFLFDMLAQQAMMFGFPPLEPFYPTQFLTERDIIHIGDEKIHILFIPGHTPGHIVFINYCNNLGFVGDTLFKGSIGRTDFPLSSHQQLIAAIKNKLLTLNEDLIFIPGHGDISCIKEEKKYNTFLQ